MRILVDTHHRDLLYALHCLFEKRLGWEMYIPIGPEWAEKGYWTMHEAHNCDSLIGQYLTHNSGDHPFCDKYKNEDGIHHIWNRCHQYHMKAVDFDRFLDMDFDIVMPTHWCHYDVWKKLHSEAKSKSTLVYHVGNIDRREKLGNVIRSVPHPGGSDVSVLVNQELNTDIYRYTNVSRGSNNIHSVTSGYMFPELYQRYKKLLPEIDFKYYGIDCPDGVLHGTDGVFEKMKEATLGWTTKGYGGLGHSNMGWMYSGRAVITNMSEHRKWGELALKLFEPGFNCIDLDSGTEKENCEMIRDWMNPDVANAVGKNARTRFLELINYEKEAEDAKEFLSKILP
jgi:hypothetical protein